jgi:hypothetical protein
MKSKSKIIKLLALIELLTAVVFMVLAVVMYISGNVISAEQEGISVTFIFLVLAMFSLISSPILFFIAKRMEENENQTPP